MAKRVVIIGAGPAGLTAGLEILRRSRDHEVVVLEATEAIGGISRTVVHHGNRMDIGGHRFFSKDDRVVRWWHEILPPQGSPSYDDRLLGRVGPLVEGGPDPDTEDQVFLTRRRVSRIYYRKKFFDYPVSLKWQTLKNLGFLVTLEVAVSYLSSMALRKPEDSLEDFYINRFGKKLYSMFFEEYTEKLWGRHPRDISADWGAQRVKGLSVAAVLKDLLAKAFSGRTPRGRVETSLIEEFSYPKLGPGQLWETVAARIEAAGGSVRRNCPVHALQARDGRIVSVDHLDQGQVCRLEGDVFISSMPLQDLVRGLGPGVPQEEARIAAELPYRDYVTIGLLVDRLNLRNETGMRTLGNLIPDCWIYIQEPGVKLGRLQIYNNWSPYMVKDVERTVWIGLEYFCREGDEFWNLSPADSVAFAVQELRSMGILDPDQPILDSHRELVPKAYPAYFGSYGEIDRLIAYLNGFSNLYCVGRNGQHRYNNMDHSMVTSFEAVGNILSGVERKDNVWNVNVEKEYHEGK